MCSHTQVHHPNKTSALPTQLHIDHAPHHLLNIMGRMEQALFALATTKACCTISKSFTLRTRQYNLSEMLYLMEFVLGVSLIYGLARCQLTAGVVITSLAITELCCAFASAIPLPTHECTPYEASIRIAPVFLGVVLLAATILQLLQRGALPSFVHLRGTLGWVLFHKTPVFSTNFVDKSYLASAALCVGYLCTATALLLLHSGVGASFLFEAEFGVGMMVLSVLPSFVVGLMGKYFHLLSFHSTIIVCLQISSVLLPLAVYHAMTKYTRTSDNSDVNC